MAQPIGKETPFPWGGGGVPVFPPPLRVRGYHLSYELSKKMPFDESGEWYFECGFCHVRVYSPERKGLKIMCQCGRTWREHKGDYTWPDGTTAPMIFGNVHI